jgi:hypothetical protein
VKKLRYAGLAGLVAVVVLATLVGVAWRAHRAAVSRNVTIERILASTRDASTPKAPRSSDNAPSPQTNPASVPPITRVPTREQRLRHWAISRNFGKLANQLYFDALKGYDGIAWLAGTEAPDRMAADIAWHAAQNGDLDTARQFLRHALLTETYPPLRRYICGQLAWLEDDPKAVVALLEASCADNTFLELRNAIELARVTGNKELERYYRQRPSVDGEDLRIYRGPVGRL